MNSLQADLTNRVVIIKQDVFPGRSEERRVFAVSGGFGCKPELTGCAVMGSFICNGESCRLDGYDMERFATDNDIQAALALKAKAGG